MNFNETSLIKEFNNNHSECVNAKACFPTHRKSAAFHLLKIPGYTAELFFLKIYSLCLSVLMTPAAFVSKSLKGKIQSYKNASRYHETHLDLKCLGAWNQYQYQGYLVCPMRNIGRVDILKNRTDLRAAREYAHTLREKLKDQYFNKILPAETNPRIAKMIVERNPEMIDDFVDKILPTDDKYESSLGGVCGLATIYFASRHFKHHQGWESIIQEAREGVNEEIAGLQSLYSASLPLIGYGALDYVSSLCKVKSTKIETIDPKQNDSANINKIGEVKDGVYAIYFLTKLSRHVILMSKEKEGVSIIDPNIGLLSCKHSQSQKLISKVISSYALRKNNSSHQIEVKQLHATDQEWSLYKDEKDNYRWGFAGS